MDRLINVTAETIFFTGRQDFNCSVEATEFAAALIGSNARFIVYENCRHMPWIEANEIFFKDLIEFILQ